jgi:hypothetical protein
MHCAQNPRKGPRLSIISHPYMHASLNILYWSPLTADSAALRSRTTASLARLRQSCSRLHTLSLSKRLSGVAVISKPNCTRGCKKAGVYLPQELDASHHLHLYNAVRRGLVFRLHPSTALGDTDYRDTGSRSHCRWCSCASTRPHLHLPHLPAHLPRVVHLVPI